MAHYMKDTQPEVKKHPRYPKWAIAWGIISVLVALSNLAQYQYGPDETLAMFIDFAFSVVVTFAFWYGLTVFIGFIHRKVNERFNHA